MYQMTEYGLAKTGECHNNIRRQISAHIFVPTIVYLVLILIWPTNVLIEVWLATATANLHSLYSGNLNLTRI